LGVAVDRGRRKNGGGADADTRLRAEVNFKNRGVRKLAERGKADAAKTNQSAQHAAAAKKATKPLPAHSPPPIAPRPVPVYAATGKCGKACPNRWCARWCAGAAARHRKRNTAAPRTQTKLKRVASTVCRIGVRDFSSKSQESYRIAPNN